MALAAAGGWVAVVTAPVVAAEMAEAVAFAGHQSGEQEETMVVEARDQAMGAALKVLAVKAEGVVEAAAAVAAMVVEAKGVAVMAAAAMVRAAMAMAVEAPAVAAAEVAETAAAR